MEAYYTFEYPDWVNVIAITDENKYILVRQYRHGIKEVNWETCAGTCDYNDPSPLYAAQRELREETGYGQGDWELFMTVSANPGTHTNRVHSFVARGVIKIADQQLDPTEDLSIHLLSYDEMKDLLEQGEIKQAVMAAPLWKYVAQKESNI